MADADPPYDPRHGEAVPLGPAILRITAPNPSPFTFHGTNSYVVGDGEVVVIDPGPDDGAHHAALLKAVGDRRVMAILLTHTHRDHSTGARALAHAVDAPVLAEGPHRASRPLGPDEGTALDAAGDLDLRPDRRLADGDRLDFDGMSLIAMATPGHAANHMVYALQRTGDLFSGDHVMGWSTTIVSPPDGRMADYMASLERLRGEPATRYLPGHGGTIERVEAYLRHLIGHRRAREAAILQEVTEGTDDIRRIVTRLYAGTHPRLHGAAAMSVLAHLEDLVDRGMITCEGPPRLSSRYRRA